MNYTEQEYNEFSNRMHERFPKIFARHYGGFACGPGWWPIIESLCANIQSHIDFKQEQKEKYQRGDGCKQVVAVQIKEKFGGLRFYYNGGDDYISGLVSMAEAWASRSCEVCGEKGSSRALGWIATLCDVHAEERKKSQNARYAD